MRITYIDACMDDLLEIENKEFNDYPLDEQRKITEKIIEHLDSNQLRIMLIKLTEYEGEFENLGDCNICGDSNFRYILDVDEVNKYLK